MKLALPRLSLDRLFTSVSWKIALIAIGPVIGVLLTVGLSQYAENQRREADQAFTRAQSDLQEVETS